MYNNKKNSWLNSMYIRNLRKPSPNKNVFKFASAKVSNVIMCESTLEFDACFQVF